MNIVEDSTDDLTVLIRNKNEEQHIGFAIQSVIDHFLKPEILVLDNNSSDDSLGVVNLFKDRADIKVINIENYTPGKSINEGVLNSTKSKILILSAHCQISEMDYGMVLDKLNKHVTVFGKQIPIYKGKKISPRYIWSHFGEKEEVNMYSVIEQRPFLHNAFSFYDKKTLIENPFDENLPGKEDRYWAIDMLEKQKSYLYLPNIKVNHFFTSNGATWKGIG